MYDQALVVLELTSEAGRADVVRAYRRLARLSHPDRNTSSNAVQRMVALNRARDVLLSDRPVPGAEPPAPASAAAGDLDGLVDRRMAPGARIRLRRVDRSPRPDPRLRIVVSVELV